MSNKLPLAIALVAILVVCAGARRRKPNRLAAPVTQNDGQTKLVSNFVKLMAGRKPRVEPVDVSATMSNIAAVTRAYRQLKARAAAKGVTVSDMVQQAAKKQRPKRKELSLEDRRALFMDIEKKLMKMGSKANPKVMKFKDKEEKLLAMGVTFLDSWAPMVGGNVKSTDPLTYAMNVMRKYA